MRLQEVWVKQGWFGPRRRCYQGFAVNGELDGKTGYYNIDADWFDSLPKDYQEVIRRREHIAAYKRSLPRRMK